MKLLYKYGTRRNEIRRAKRELYMWISLVLAILLFFTGMIIVAKFRPRLDESEVPTTETNVGDPLKNPRLIELRREVETILTGISSQPLDMDNMEALEQAISLQREVIRLRGSEVAARTDLDKLEELLTLYDMQMGDFLIGQSNRLEDEARDFEEERQYAKAIAALIKARNLQEEVNQQYPRSTKRNPSRLHLLNNQLVSLQTQPIADEADRLKEEALQLVEMHQFSEAKERMKEAVNMQRELNISHRGSRLASMSRLREFEETWKQVRIAEEVNHVERLTKEARSALQLGQYSLAISSAEEAEVQQRKIMDSFPELAVAQPEILADISRLKDTAASLPSFEKIKDLEKSVRALLRKQEMEPFKNQVSEWLRTMKGFMKDYPNSEFVSQLNDTQVIYLHKIREDVPGILETVYANLIAIPGNEAIKLYRTEVPQSLFSLVTATNPSVQRDASLPVDSVTWEESNDFLVKLSWILDRPAKLPDRDLFMSAMGTMAVEDIRERAWSSENTDREIQPVGTSKPNRLGFYDLAGNIAEWLDISSSELSGRATAIGGSVRDDAMRLARLPEESRSTSERNRFVGFRFIVDLSE